MITMYTIDFETYYDDKYSLKNMTTEEYVNDPRFEIIGVGIATQGGEARWYSLPTHQQYAEILKPLHGTTVVVHNAMFDAAILEWVLGITPKLYIDTLSMAVPHFGSTVGGSLAALATQLKLGVKGTEVVDAKGKHRADFTPTELAQYGVYCRNDVTLTQRLLQKLHPLTTSEEYYSIHNTITMFTRPMLELDVALLEQSFTTIAAAKAEAVALSGVSKEDLMSNPRFAQALITAGAKVPMKSSVTNGRATYAFAKTDEGFTALLHHDNPQVRQLVKSRLICKSTIMESRTKTLLGVASRNNGLFPVPLKYCGAQTTWRWSGMDDVNAQNFPHKGGLRDALRAPPGMKVVVVDSSNIELRVTHMLAGQDDTIKLLRNGADLYCVFATELYGRDITKADERERFVGKQAMLGLQYHCGPARFQEMLRQKDILLPLNECEDIVTLWRNTYHRIPAFWRAAGKMLDAMAFGGFADGLGTLELESRGERILTPNQHFIEYPGLTKTRDGYMYSQRQGKVYVPTNIYSGKVVENLCQHLARIIVAEQWNKVAKTWAVKLQSHDEIAMVVPNSLADECLEQSIDIFSTPPTWWKDLPLAAEGGIGDTYGEAK